MPAIMSEQPKIEKAKTAIYRPPQKYLDLFWKLSDGTEDSLRNEGAVKLSQLIQDAETEDQSQILEYCRDRLIRGLSSSRKFARVGFSVALTQLLRSHTSLTTPDVLYTIKHKLKIQGQDKKSKADMGGIFLGKAFAFSALIQSGRLAKMTSAELEPIFNEILALSQKKSYLKPVCNNILEDLVKQVSVDTFGECVWPKIRDSVKEGWEGCTLDKLSLVLVCRGSHADVVNKKFLKKHFGYPVLSIENDEKLMKVILGTVTQKTEILLKKILPPMLQNDRTALSIWQGIGEPLLSKALEKKSDSSSQRQLLGLKLATSLLSCTNDKDQILELMACPSLAPAVFNNNISSKQDPLAVEANSLFDQLCTKVKTLSIQVDSLVSNLWSLATDLLEDSSKANTRDIITSTNFLRLMDLMEKEKAVKFAESMVEAIKGKSKTMKLSNNETAKKRQIESCIRCLHHALTSQYITSGDLQKIVMPLFLRLAFFTVTKKSSGVQHCDTLLNLEDGKAEQKLCKTLFFKSLDQLSTTAGGSSKKKSDHLESYVSLLIHLTEYVQELIKADKVKPMQDWTDEMSEEWNKIFKLLSKIQKKSKGQKSGQDTAFLLLFLFLAFNMLNDFKMAADLLQEVQVCFEKANKQKKEKISEDGSEPAWQEVVTEVLLNLMSLPSHLGRVISCSVLRSLTPHMTPGSTQLITQVLIPKAGRGDDADGAMVEGEAGDDDEEDDDDDDMVDADEPDEESDDDSDEDGEDEEEEEEEEEEEKMQAQVDEKFRASVKEALGAAAVMEESDEEEELSDLSDSEMFKLDDMLAEVFRQKKKAGQGRQNREEKKKEMATFRLRVLDLVEVLVKSDRCGDFVIDLMRPLLLLTLKSDADLSVFNKAKSVFQLLRSRAKGLTDSAHSAEDQKDLLQELLELAHTVSETSHVSDVSSACHMTMNLKYSEDESSENDCNTLIQDTLKNVIIKGKPKPPPSFFSNLIENDAAKYQFLLPMLVDCLKDNDTLKLHGKMICCSVLASLMRRTQKTSKDGKKTQALMNEAVSVVSQTILSLNASNIKVMFTKEMLNLAIAIQNKQDFFVKSPYGKKECDHLSSLKSKFNTDLKRLANKFITAVTRAQKRDANPKNDKKRKLDESPEQNGFVQNGVDHNDISNGVEESTSTPTTTPNKPKMTKRKLSIGEESMPKKKRTHNEPYRRVSGSIKVDSKFMNNSFEAKKGASGSWGERASRDLIVTKGKSFKHEKTKKKRGSYRGGSIDASSVHSIKFDSD